MITFAQYVAPAAIEWLNLTKEARVLNAFNKSVNLINSEKMILSLVNPQLGRGPFALTLDNDPLINNKLGNSLGKIDHHAKVRITESHLHVGPLTVNYTTAETWHPRPDWTSNNESYLDVHLRTLSMLLSQVSGESLAKLLVGNIGQDYQTRIAISWSEMRRGLSRKQSNQVQDGAWQIAGLGPGLTPAGDDFLVGLIFALWVMLDSARAIPLADTIFKAAAPRTTSLSAAWLQSAARGEASEAWHSLIRGLHQPEKEPVWEASMRIIQTGQSSGADALTGFVLGLESIR